MSVIRELPRAEWQAYFDAFSKRKQQTGRIDYAEIRVFSLEDGVQPETSWLPLQGLTYDPKSDLLDVQVAGLDHLVARPVKLFVDEDGDMLERIEIIRSDDAFEIIELR